MNEGKQVGIVYHFTSLNLSLEILKTDLLKAGNPTQRDFSTRTVSTTRNKNFSKNKPNNTGVYTEICFVLDGNKLSNRYQSAPFDDSVERGGKVNYFSRDRWGDEYEEIWYGQSIQNDRGFKNLKSYILKIIITKNFITKLSNMSKTEFIRANKMKFSGV